MAIKFRAKIKEQFVTYDNMELNQLRGIKICIANHTTILYLYHHLIPQYNEHYVYCKLACSRL